MPADRLLLVAAAAACSLFIAAEGRGAGPSPGTDAPKWEIADQGSFFYNQGLRAVKKGQWRIAVAYFKRAAAEDPKSADAQNMLGYSYRKLGSTGEALDHYRRALELDPKHRGAHEYMGEAYLERDDLQRARDVRSRLHKLCPDGCDELAQLDAAIAQYQEASP